MGAAITLLVILTISVVVVRTAAVALRLTGMPADVARFQARSAFTGAGFTTSESEAVVNHPIRRRLIGLLMLLGNVGLVTVMATFIVSFLASGNSMTAMSVQMFWLLGAIALLWFIALNSFADRVMCRLPLIRGGIGASSGGASGLAGWYVCLVLHGVGPGVVE